MKYIYVTRDYKDRYYRLCQKKPEYLDGVWGKLLDDYIEICADVFEEATGIKLKGGPRSIVRIKKFKPIRA